MNYFDDITNMLRAVHQFKIEPDFEFAKKQREGRIAFKIETEAHLLEIFVHLIAYSQQAKSNLVRDLLENKKTLDIVFENYDVNLVASKNPCDLVDKYWKQCTAIRHTTKFFHVVMFARLLKKKKEVFKKLASPQLPKTVSCEDDLKVFWDNFESLQSFLKEVKAPFLREKTTLLHFLLHTGFFCVKPDSAVMKSSLKIGIVKSKTGDANLIKTVQSIQSYALHTGIAPAVLDLYFLIDGGQKDAAKLVRKEYYALRPLVD